jgi:Flp pilus assembly protein TadD
MRDAKFWLTLALFQVAFGLTVFAATRHYYLARRPEAPLPAWALGLGATLPSAPAAASLPSAASPTPAAGPAPAPVSAPQSDDSASLSARAEDAFNAGRYDEAAQLFQQMLDLDPQNVELYNELGLTLHYSGHSAEALEKLAAGAKLNPNHQRLWLTTGFVNLRLGRNAEARAALIKARDLGDDVKIRESAEKMLEGLPK